MNIEKSLGASKSHRLLGAFNAIIFIENPLFLLKKGILVTEFIKRKIKIEIYLETIYEENKRTDK